MFSAKPGAKDTDLKATALSVTPILEKMPGYLSREFGASGDGQYVDIVRWKGLSSALAAAQQVMKIPECGKFFALIDESKMQSNSPQDGGQPALQAVEKSAEGIVSGWRH